MRLEARVDFLGRRDLLVVDDAAAGLIDDAVSQLAKIGDLLSQHFNVEDIGWGSSPKLLGSFQGMTRVF